MLIKLTNPEMVMPKDQECKADELLIWHSRIEQIERRGDEYFLYLDRIYDQHPDKVQFPNSFCCVLKIREEDYNYILSLNNQKN